MKKTGILYSDSDRKRYNEANGLSNNYSDFREDVVNLINSLHFRRLENKSQLFPALESDLFRNRLTHTLEVSRIAQDIAVNLNKDDFFKEDSIDIDLVNFAAYAHDIGHPPFGHTGEHALDEMMYSFGGFEGNAQTLRIICKLIRKFRKPVNPGEENEDNRIGINPTYRSIASVLKYDHELSSNPRGSKIEKGYYKSESHIINESKKAVLNGYELQEGEIFRTLECSIMDVADDIAYSTYDIEDAMRSEMLNIMDFFYPKQEVIDAVIDDIVKTRGKKDYLLNREVHESKIRKELTEFGRFLLELAENEELKPEMLSTKFDDYTIGRKLTDWVAKLIHSVSFKPHYSCPALTKVFLDKESEEKVEILKVFVFQTITLSAPLQAISFKGHKIVSELFLAIVDTGDKLLPQYERIMLNNLIKDRNSKTTGLETKRNRSIEAEINRIYCDYIANMTDEFAYSVYKQLLSSELNPTVNVLRQY